MLLSEKLHFDFRDIIVFLFGFKTFNPTKWTCISLIKQCWKFWLKTSRQCLPVRLIIVISTSNPSEWLSGYSVKPKWIESLLHLHIQIRARARTHQRPTIMSRRKQLRPFKVQDDDDDDSNAKQIKSADNGVSTPSNGHNTHEAHTSSKFDTEYLLYLFMATSNHNNSVFFQINN